MNDVKQESLSGLVARDVFSRMLSKPAIAGSFFLPIDRAQWIGDSYTLGKQTAPLPKGQFVGARLQVPDPRNLDASRAQYVQGDLTELVKSVAELRKNPTLASAVLSPEIIISRDHSGVARARFGLKCPASGAFRNDSDAARECHRNIVSAIHKSGLQIDFQPPLDFGRGFEGLTGWTSGLRLKQGWRLDKKWWPWLIALLLLPFLFRSCDCDGITFGDTTIRTRSFVIVLDSSSSMQPYFTDVKNEAKRVLDGIEKSSASRFLGVFGWRHYVDLITYTNRANSVFNKLTPVDAQSTKAVTDAIASLSPGGGTDLRTAISKAAEEIKDHGKPTTLVIITDGEDGSITAMEQEMRADKAKVESQFGGTAFYANSMSPRLLNASQRSSAPGPQNDYESALAAFSEAFHGQFGSTTNVKRN